MLATCPTTADLLLAGISADPAEETRWLALADCLEESEQYGRAELLRLHRRLLATCCDPENPERTAWHARIAELIAGGVQPCIPQKTLQLPGGIPMTFSFVPPGSFLMGSERGDPDERPVHKVRLTKGFFMGIYPVTQAQWKAVMGTDPSHFKGEDRPVESVSWNDSQEFCKKLTAILKNKVTVGLPTEAEWEYACRAGTTTEYYTGDGEGASKRAAWYWDNSDRQTHPVGQLEANAFGLYDMHGNVWEWCHDWYASYVREEYHEEPPFASCVGAPGTPSPGTVALRPVAGTRPFTASATSGSGSVSEPTEEEVDRDLFPFVSRAGAPGAASPGSVALRSVSGTRPITAAATSGSGSVSEPTEETEEVDREEPPFVSCVGAPGSSAPGTVALRSVTGTRPITAASTSGSGSVSDEEVRADQSPFVSCVGAPGTASPGTVALRTVTVTRPVTAAAAAGSGSVSEPTEEEVDREEPPFVSRVGAPGATAPGTVALRSVSGSRPIAAAATTGSGSVSDEEIRADRITRGGSWLNNARVCRAASRYGSAPDYRYSNCGFRVCFRLD